MKKFILNSIFLFGLLSICTICGCNSSVTIIQNHLNDMVEIAESNKNDCNALGPKLNEYMDKHDESLKKMISHHNNATEEEAKL